MREVEENFIFNRTTVKASYVKNETLDLSNSGRSSKKYVNVQKRKN